MPESGRRVRKIRKRRLRKIRMMRIPAQSEKFTPMQHHLLNLFASDRFEEDLAQKATEEMDTFLDEQQLDVIEWTAATPNERLRTT